MTKMDRRREQRRQRYEDQLGPELAAIIEADTSVLTLPMCERQWAIACRYRDLVRQMAGS